MQTKTEIVLGLSLFYAALGLLAGIYGNNLTTTTKISSLLPIYIPVLSDILNLLGGIITSISVMPIWMTTLVFTPLVITIIWLIAGGGS